jgi:secondary thiamine-phosphate synthase enzyme
MQLANRARPSTAVNMHRLAFRTRDDIEFVDITDQVAAAVRSTGVSHGIVTVVSRHTTMAVRIQEDEPLLLQELGAFLRRLAPANDISAVTQHRREDESRDPHSHCLQFLLGTSETVPVENGELLLGQQQRIFLVELDGPRTRREVLVQTVGICDDFEALV